MKDRNTAQVNNALRAVYSKAVLVGVTLVLLLSILVYITVAWYTKMVSVSGMEFEAARWDFTANYAISDMKVSVYEHASLSDEGRAAPGSWGTIPITLSARQSDTDIEYTIQVDRSTMSEDFQQRIFFSFYQVDEDGNRIKYYFHGSPSDPSADMITMTGVIKNGQHETVQIYWEWVYEAPEDAPDEEKILWDEFDTNVGKNPELYIKDMYATISIAGVEVEPEGDMPNATEGTAPTMPTETTPETTEPDTAEGNESTDPVPEQ